MAACGRSDYGSTTNEVPVEVDVIVTHFADNATLRIGSTVSQTGEYWGIQNGRLWRKVPRPSPPSPPSLPGQWTFVQRFVFPRDVDAWDGDAGCCGPAHVTTCGSVGTMLGGYEVFGVNAYAERTFSGLPPHTHVRVQFTFIRIDQCPQQRFEHPPNLMPCVAN